MEIVLNVERFQGQPPGAPICQTFGTEGGTIGRVAANDWVLSDPSRFTSSKHAQIHFNGNHFCITDLSTNGTFVNSLDSPIGRNNVAPLADGDRIFIGEYEVSVTVRAEDAMAATTPAAAQPSASEPAAAVGGDGDDWFAQPSAPADEFLQPLEPEQSAPAPATPAQTPEQEYFTAPASTPGGGHEIPDDWDSMLSGVMPGPQLEATAPPPAQPTPQPPTPQPSPAPAPQAAPPSPTQPPTQAPDPAPAPAARQPQPAVPAPPRPATPAAAVGGDAMRQALLDGLQTNGIAPAISTEQLSRELASAVRLLTEGMMEVLAARSSMKDEFRLSQTRIGPAMNNPLKFSPSVDEALHRMFSNDDRGFLRGQEAFRQALNDVKAHQVALLAGLQAGLQAILKYFAPDNLEKHINDYASIASKVPGVREAKLWNQFTALYDRIAKDAESDFQKLFSREFAEAYEDQIRSLLSASGEQQP